MCSGLVKRRETLIVLSVQFPRASSAVMVKLNAELKVIVEFLSKVRTTFPFFQKRPKISALFSLKGVFFCEMLRAGVDPRAVMLCMPTEGANQSGIDYWDQLLINPLTPRSNL